MKKIIFLFFLLTKITVYSQDSINDKHIYLKRTDVSSTTFYKGGGTTSSKGTYLDFTVGVNGKLQNMGKRGKNLYEIIKSDPEAEKEFRIASKYLRKKRLCNVLEIVSIPVMIGSVIPIFIGGDREDPLNAITVAGVAGAAVGVFGFYYCGYKTDKYMEKYFETIHSSINIYNNNLKKQK